MKNRPIDKKTHYVVWVHVKPYVARYLVDNFGVANAGGIRNLVDIRGDKALMAFFSPRLEKKTHRYDKRLAQKGKGNRTVMVAIEVSASSFTRSGWSISDTDESAFARLLELRCQGILLAFLSAHYMISGDAALSIRTFYRVFHQDEDSWPYDSIRKIWNRNVKSQQKVTLKGRLEKEIIDKLLVQLSSFGTISHKGLELYEGN